MADGRWHRRESSETFLGDGAQPLGQSADAAIGAFLGDHAAGRGSSDFALGDLEGVGRSSSIPRIQGFATMLDHRAHLGADMLIALSTALGLTNALEGGFVIGQRGLSLLMGAASYSGLSRSSRPHLTEGFGVR